MRRTCFCFVVTGAPPSAAGRDRARASHWFARFARSLRRLSGLALHDLTRVAHALALVGLGLAYLADVGRHLAHDLLVDAAHSDARGLRHLEGHAFRRLDRHRMAEAQRQLEARRALGNGSVANADDLQVFAEAIGHAHAHVVDQRTRESLQTAVLALVVGTLDQDLCAVLAHGDVGREATEERALGALHRDLVAGNTDVDARGDGDGGFADTRHLNSHSNLNY